MQYAKMKLLLNPLELNLLPISLLLVSSSCRLESRVRQVGSNEGRQAEHETLKSRVVDKLKIHFADGCGVSGAVLTATFACSGA